MKKCGGFPGGSPERRAGDLRRGMFGPWVCAVWVILVACGGGDAPAGDAPAGDAAEAVPLPPPPAFRGMPPSDPALADAFAADSALGTMIIRVQDQVKDMLVLDGGAAWALHGKTGWAFEVEVGWWVGWAERDGQTYVFALNMALPDADRDPPKRVRVGRRALAAVGALPGEGP